jgi:hypothetical protein
MEVTFWTSAEYGILWRSDFPLSVVGKQIHAIVHLKEPLLRPNKEFIVNLIYMFHFLTAVTLKSGTVGGSGGQFFRTSFRISGGPSQEVETRPDGAGPPTPGGGGPPTPGGGAAPAGRGGKPGGTSWGGFHAGVVVSAAS